MARLAGRGLGANVVSAGEWAIARRAGVPNDAITLEGVGKTDADLRAAVRAAVDGTPLAWVAVESGDELERLISLADAAGLGTGRRRPPLDVLVRSNPDVAPETHAGLAVGAGASKFGMTETELTEAVERAAGSRSVRPRGIHLHVGSQLGAIDAWRDAVRRCLALIGLVRGGLPDFDTLDVGGGFPVGPRGRGPEPGAVRPRDPGRSSRTIPADRRPERLGGRARPLPGRSRRLARGVASSTCRDRGETPLVVLDTGMTELIRPGALRRAPSRSSR